MESVAGAVPENTVRVCRLDGCERPVPRRSRKYCSRHGYLADVDYVWNLSDRPDLRAARGAARQVDDAERISAPIQHVEAVQCLVEPIDTSVSPLFTFSSIDSTIKPAQRLNALGEDFERALTPRKRLLSILPAPSRMARFQREAKYAWLRYHEGEPEPLDSFISKYVVRLKNRKGPVPGKVRRGVVGVLDECFAPVLIYAPGDWYIFGSTAQENLVDFAGGERKKFGSVSYDARLEDKLPGIILTAWDELQWATDTSTRTLFNRIDIILRADSDVGPKWMKIAERRPHAFPGEDAEKSLALFEAREAVRQQVETLPRLIERAELSPQERLVYEFDLRVGRDFETIEEATEAAARALDRSRESVRTFRFRRRKKLHQVVDSDPWFQKIFKEIASDL
jgi:hypothetical protein